MYERYRYLSQIKFDKWRVVTTPIAGIVAACFAFSELQNMCFIKITRSDVMKTANTSAFFGRRDAGRDISKIIPLVKLARKSFIDAIYQSYVKLH